MSNVKVLTSDLALLTEVPGSIGTTSTFYDPSVVAGRLAVTGLDGEIFTAADGTSSMRFTATSATGVAGSYLFEGDIYAADTGEVAARISTVVPLTVGLNTTVIDVPLELIEGDDIGTYVLETLSVISADDASEHALAGPVSVSIVTPTCRGVAATIVGTPGDDTLTGTDGDDVIVGQGGADTINGGLGNDLICGGRGADTINGGDGDDEIRGNRGQDTIAGNEGDDILRGGRGNDTIRGNSGADFIRGGKGEDLLIGGGGADEIHGGRNADEIRGGAGQDRLFGGRGPDVITGGSGADRLAGGRGNDSLDGGPGADKLFGGPGNDSCVNGTKRSC